MKKIVIASNNAGKLREIRAILAPFGLDAVSQKEAGFDAEVEETGTTFAENAALKAHAVHEALHCAVIADDSGLLVDALASAPRRRCRRPPRGGLSAKQTVGSSFSDIKL